MLVENCHASRMSVECFVAGGSSRGTVKPGRSYTQSTTYLRCSATDCARNGLILRFLSRFFKNLPQEPTGRCGRILDFFVAVCFTKAWEGERYD